jgi:hypothetical protein
MKTGVLNLTLRPIKLAFIVDVSDNKSVLEAIRINSLLWGGVYNPIIPYFERKPKILANDFFFKLEDNAKILRGYLNAYDPDFVIQLGKCAGKAIDLGGREKISLADILSGMKDDSTVGYGISIFEVLNHFYSKELKFVRKNPINVIKPKFSARNHLFLASVFGELPDEWDKEFTEGYRKPFGFKMRQCNISNFHTFLDNDYLFMRRFTALYIDPIRHSSHFNDRLLFLMDPTNPIDVIDYWNLRALGIGVFPIPKQEPYTEEIKQFSLKYIDESFGQSRYNPKIYYTATVQKSRGTTEDEAKKFVNFLNVKKDDKSGEPKISLSFSYPRIWDDWARDKDGAESPDLETDTMQKDLSGDLTSIDFKTLSPKFMSRFGGHGEPRYANEIELRAYGDSEIMAEVMPQGNADLANKIGGYGFREWRLSKKGLVYLSQHAKWTVHLPLPKAQPVFLDWMKSLGWKEAKISSAGHIGKQLIKHLGGIRGIETIRNEKLLELLGNLTGQDKLLSSLSKKITVLEKTLKTHAHEEESKKVAEFLVEIEDARQAKELKEGPILHEHLLAEISKALSTDRFKSDPNKYLERLTEINMFRLGVLMQCPVCQKHSWYSLDELKYELKCPKCLDTFSPPVHSPKKDMPWAYRPFGPFSLPNLASGNYSVLLTLRFFSEELDGAVTPSMSFILERDAQPEFEVDLGMLFSSTKFGNSTVVPIFSDCKSWNNFDEKGVKNLENLGQQTPGAILVFSTFKKTLEASEIALLTALIKRSRKNRTVRKPFNQIMILTGTELFADFGPPECWENGTAEQKALAKTYRRYDGLDELCDVTQQMYLGFKPWQEEVQEYYDIKRAKREEKKKTG